MVLHYNPSSPSTEPYIRLPAPLSHIILTPPRLLPESETQAGSASSTSANSAINSGDYDDAQKAPEDNRLPPESDIAACMSGLNDKRVYMYLEATPYPYEREHAISWIREQYASTQAILRQHQHQQRQKNSKDETLPTWLSGCPFRDIRDTSLVSPDSISSSPSSTPNTDSSTTTTNASSSSSVEGDDRERVERLKVSQAPKVGDIMLAPYAFYELVVGSEQCKQARERNAALPAGHEDMIWGVGFWLHPSHHKQGIMSAALSTIIEDWAVPKMNVRLLKSAAFVGNEASVGVHLKCGFVVEQVVEKASGELSESRGGGRRDLVVLRRERRE